MTNINGKTSVYSLLAQSTTHSLSPLIHNFSAECLGLNAVYIPMPYAGDNLGEFLKVADDINLQGFNVTVPFKEEVANALGLTGSSINTVYRKDGQWAATSTDAEGFCNGLSKMKKNIEDFENIVFLGNGGAALALASYMYDKYDIAVHVVRRSVCRDSLFPKASSFYEFSLDGLKAALKGRKGTLLVQSTSAPLSGNSLKELVPAIEDLNGCFVDLVYKTPSALFYEAERRGLPCIDGLPMLVEQAVLSQKYWWGESVDSNLIYEFLDRNGV